MRDVHHTDEREVEVDEEEEFDNYGVEGEGITEGIPEAGVGEPTDTETESCESDDNEGDELPLARVTLVSGK